MRTRCLLLSPGLLLATAAPAQSLQPSFKFDFGPGQPAAGYQQVLPTAAYTDATGYGFDFGTTITGVDRGGKDALKSDFVTSPQPFYFSVKLPEGNYNVTVTLGDAKGPSSTFLKAESRRLLLETTATKPDQLITRTFTINVKSRRINDTETVSLKPRELHKLDWDDRLTLEFDGSRPCLAALEITPAPQATTVFLAGNSTVVDQDDEPWAAWGQMLPRFLKPGVAVANHAESGLALGSFLSSKRLAKVLSVMKPGDYLFIEFGHNDQKDKGENDGAWKAYSERLHFFVQETRRKGGIPVIVTSTSRRTFGADGRIENSLGDFPAAARKVAEEEKVALIDLNAMTTKLYEALGVEESKKALVHYPANTYPGQTAPLADNTHFNPYGAYEIAKCVVEGIKANKLGLAKFLRDDTPAFDPAKPDALAAWVWPDSPRSAVTKPDGN
ncbi:rhamnogalacturonan acetylesterase [Hymenobacter properus]|uniref:Rhamnogalacturonan acetylesterase n=1 Tax=Hymenobacter properus TaxID=2791026 RepID=A0A931BEK6_9BACT|nr:rhamnogalacturonan acetylesterase [Hymenobacter properus]MBF9141111.1 rhamnogalacturonan acetylesterase [Hymenobacter properus]MBR7719920.1 rhamnogalacturonan acetylesterase [Microvirga sp. SRT04]